jgi:hypothetical protein
MLCGPKGVGKSSLLSLLASDHGNRLRWVQLLTTKPCYKGEEDGSSAWVVPYAALVRGCDRIQLCILTCVVCVTCWRHHFGYNCVDISELLLEYRHSSVSVWFQFSSLHHVRLWAFTTQGAHAAPQAQIHI